MEREPIPEPGPAPVEFFISSFGSNAFTNTLGQNPSINSILIKSTTDIHIEKDSFGSLEKAKKYTILF